LSSFFSDDSGNSSFFSSVAAAGAGAVVELDGVDDEGVGLSDLAPARARPKRAFPPALYLGRVSLPLGAVGAGAGGSVDFVGVELEVERPDIRDASEATGWSSAVVVDVEAESQKVSHKGIEYQRKRREGKRRGVCIPPSREANQKVQAQSLMVSR
jgi:hypothetical protein